MDLKKKRRMNSSVWRRRGKVAPKLKKKNFSAVCVLCSSHSTSSRHLQPWGVRWERALETTRGVCLLAQSAAISRGESGSNQRAAWQRKKPLIVCSSLRKWVVNVGVLAKTCAMGVSLAAPEAAPRGSSRWCRPWEGTRNKQKSAHLHCGATLV